MPELFFDAQEAVPEPIRNIAVEKDGKWAVNVVPKTELDDFRNRNVELARERDANMSVLGRLQTDAGLDPTKLDDFIGSITELREVKQQVDDGKLVADSSLNEAVEAKTGELKRNLEGQITGLKNENVSLKGENDTIKQKLNRSIVDREIMTAINDPKSGALPEATRQILREAYDIFSVSENEELVAKDHSGNVVYGGDGATPITPLEWLQKLQEKTPFFFKSAQGGGAGGGQGNNTGPLSAADIAKMSPEEKMNYGRAHGLNKTV